MNLITAILEAYRDGKPHNAAIIEADLRKSFNLRETCRTAFILDGLKDDGAMKELRVDEYQITGAGLEMLGRLRNEAQVKRA